MASLPSWASFPNPVNEKAARTVAAGVLLLALVTLAVGLATGSWWLVLLLVLGFAARTLAGPRYSALGRLATHVVAPRLGAAAMVPGPPKRFAQAIGLTLTTVAAVLGLAVGADLATAVLLGILVVFAFLESVVGFCAGCAVFGALMRAGIIPEDTCEECNNIWLRYGRTAA